MFDTVAKKANIKLYKIQKKRIECGWPETCRKTRHNSPTEGSQNGPASAAGKVSLSTFGKIAPKRESFHLSKPKNNTWSVEEFEPTNVKIQLREVAFGCALGDQNVFGKSGEISTRQAETSAPRSIPRAVPPLWFLSISL